MKYSFQPKTENFTLFKFDLKMRLSLLFLLIPLLGMQAENTYAQKVISLNAEDVSVSELLNTIENKTDYRFTYKIGDIDLKRTTTLKVDNEKVADVLEEVFKDTNAKINFFGDQVFISQKDLAPIIDVSINSIQQDEIIVTGMVTDEEDTPLPGVNIAVEGTSKGTSTDFDGEYEIVTKEGQVLTFSAVGFSDQTIEVEDDEINVVMEEGSALDEVVVVGYGERAREELTGSVASIDEKSISRNRTSDLRKGLQGTMPGLVVKDVGGEPGSEDTEISIRGTHTLGDNSPLYVVDGIPRDNIADISSYDVESISVLKDASAAIYGARAANGVILVQTKRGKKGKPTLQVNTEFGTNVLTRTPEMMSSEQYAIYRNEAFDRNGQQKPFSSDDIEKYKTGSDPLTHPNTDWYGATFKKHAPISNHNISIAGGSDNLQYLVSGSFEDQKANYSSGDGYFQKYQLRSNIDAQVHKYLNIGVDLNLRWKNRKMPSVGIGDITHAAWFAYPTEIDQYPNGLPGTVHEDRNTTVLNSFDIGHNKRGSNIVHPKLSFDFDMGWLTSGLSLDGYAAFSYDLDEIEIHEKPTLTYEYNLSTEEFDEHVTLFPGDGHIRLNQESKKNKNTLYHMKLNYNKRFGRHGVDAFVAYEQSETKTNFISAGRKDLFSENKLQLFAGEEDGRSVDGSATVGGRVNYFGSFSYDYDRKYLIDFTFRRDGSFNFPKNKRFGSFPSISLGWNISDEVFMERLTDGVLDNLKLKASYGKMGNDRIADYQFLSKYETGSFALFGTESSYNPAFSIVNIPNPDITWEESHMYNYGLEASLFHQRLMIALDYFNEERKGILIQRNLSIPLYTAITLPDENLGRVNNHGFEAQLGYEDQVGEINFGVGGNFTFNRSKIKFMDEPKNIPDYQKQEGHPVNSIMAYETDGVFRSQEEIDNYPHLSGSRPGDIKYVDINGDGKINDEDKKRFYKTTTPEIQFGLNGNIDYRGFGLSFTFQGQAKAKTALRFNDDGTKPVEYFTERWTEDNPDSKKAAAMIGRDPKNRLSTYHLIDASYLRLKNIELSYDFTKMKLMDGGLFDNLRIYLRARNLLTVDKIKIFDPEVPFQEDEERGSRAKYYPQTTMYSIGLNITL